MLTTGNFVWELPINVFDLRGIDFFYHFNKWANHHLPHFLVTLENDTTVLIKTPKEVAYTLHLGFGGIHVFSEKGVKSQEIVYIRTLSSLQRQLL